VRLKARAILDYAMDSPVYFPALKRIDAMMRDEIRQGAFSQVAAVPVYRKLVEAAARSHYASDARSYTFTKMYPPAARDEAARMFVNNFLLYHVNE
jgi:hypothetical protein